MKSAKTLIIISFLFVCAVQVLAQTGKTTPSLDSLDLINLNGGKTPNPATDLVTPNELTGYEFVKKGRLNALRIGMSTKADVIKIFGSDCTKSCQYSPDWTIGIEYFEQSKVLVSRTYGKNRADFTEKQYVPRAEVVGKIEAITLVPKKRVSFANVAFPAQFMKNSFLEFGYLAIEKKDRLDVSIDLYGDSYGLQYFIFDKIVNDQLEDSFDLKRKYAKFQKGDLLSVKYTITEATESRFWVEEQ